MFAYVPLHLLDYKLCLQVVMNGGSYIYRIPEIYRDYNMFLFAVNEEAAIFSSVPENFKTDDMIRAAIRNPDMYQHVPIEKRIGFIIIIIGLTVSSDKAPTYTNDKYLSARRSNSVEST